MGQIKITMKQLLLFRSNPGNFKEMLYQISATNYAQNRQTGMIFHKDDRGYYINNCQ